MLDQMGKISGVEKPRVVQTVKVVVESEILDILKNREMKIDATFSLPL